MRWNWELPEWPTFTFDPDRISHMERQFLLNVGGASASLKSIDEREYKRFIVEILSLEGLESAKIEGELLDRESLQSSIRKHFGLQTDGKFIPKREAGMAKLQCAVYESFDQPLTHEMLYEWHTLLFKDASHLDDIGIYRTHPEPMQIVSNRYDTPTVFFEAPPSAQVQAEMTHFIHWFNFSKGAGSILARAAIAHLYFESIHPFEDGNGRIGRVLVEKVLSQEVGRPILIAISQLLEKRKKDYYAALEKCNRTLQAQDWVDFFAQIIFEAHEESLRLALFIVGKANLLNRLSGQLNPRQEKVLLRMFAEGPNGFKGGLSAQNYIAITKTTRPTATRDLTDLVDKGALFKTGELRHTRYWLNF